MPSLPLVKPSLRICQKVVRSPTSSVRSSPLPFLFSPTLPLRGSTIGFDNGGGKSASPPDFKSILHNSMKNQMGSDDRFDGKFSGGPGFLDSSLIANMQKTMQANLTPEMKESMSSLLQQHSLSNGDGVESLLNNLRSGAGGMKMGMMAFGMGENEKGKKVARAAKMSVDLQTGKLEKDFMEKQVEPDDVALPKETVESYETEGAIEVEFVSDDKKGGAA